MTALPNYRQGKAWGGGTTVNGEIQPSEITHTHTHTTNKIKIRCSNPDDGDCILISVKVGNEFVKILNITNYQ